MIYSPGDFLLGAIAPDAVHFHKEYHTDLKEKSHLWNCGPKWGITLQSDKWKENVLEFWKIHKNDINRDFVAGCCIHILTDWLNDIIIWTPFRNANLKNEDVREIYHIYGDEALGSDRWLYENSQNSKRIMELLAVSSICAVDGCVEKEDVCRMKQHILRNQYAGTDTCDISNYQYCTKEIVLSFIDECVKNFEKVLTID